MKLFGKRKYSAAERAVINYNPDKPKNPGKPGYGPRHKK